VSATWPPERVGAPLATTSAGGTSGAQRPRPYARRDVRCVVGDRRRLPSRHHRGHPRPAL